MAKEIGLGRAKRDFCGPPYADSRLVAVSGLLLLLLLLLVRLHLHRGCRMPAAKSPGFANVKAKHETEILWYQAPTKVTTLAGKLNDIATPLGAFMRVSHVLATHKFLLDPL